MKTIERNWGAEEWRAPDARPTDEILYSECGRIVDNVDHRSHYFRLVKREDGSFSLIVKHGGGQEEISGWFLRKILGAMAALSPDARYLLMYSIFQANRDGKNEGRDKTVAIYRNSFVEGRLKKRKVRNSTAYKVWIEPPKAVTVS